MASVFLSYDRDDAEAARAIAALVEKAGHEVWWDKHISGGSQYAKEIAQALDESDVVLVLWSNSSIESPWVRDEAGAGRDRGRLVPLSLDGTPPPLGFRQFHSIDLGNWSDRGKLPHSKEVLSAIERQSKVPDVAAALGGAPAKPRANRSSLNMWAIIGVAIAMFFVVVGLLIGQPWDPASPTKADTAKSQ